MRTGKLGIGLGWVPVLLPLTVLLAGCSHRSGQCRGGTCGDGGSTYAAGAFASAPATVASATSLYGGQKTCPVTGAALGAAGPAVPVAVRGQTIYVCCQGCAAKVQAAPDAYLARVTAERAGGQPAALPQTAAAPLYNGQKTCPVMGEELDPNGGAIPVTVKGQTIYVCCQGCAGKVKRDPDTYLAKVAAERARLAGGRP